jgi:repressor LexA
MRSKNHELMFAIISYIDKIYDKENKVPSMQEIADEIGLSKSMVSRYITEMQEKGMIEKGSGHYSLITPYIRKVMPGNQRLPIVGAIACGTPILAEENIESYLTISGSFLGAGEHFVLIAQGDSMINVGIEDGDYVIIKKQNVANEGQIVVALIDNEEATLKRFYNDKRRKKIRLHPENNNLKDMFYVYESVNIQGIAIKVIKNIDF